MPRKVLKRKSSELADKENTDEFVKISKKSNHTSSLSVANEKWIPKIARDFYSEYGMLESISSIRNAKFVGPFRVLNGQIEEKGLGVMMVDRHLMDLPEMQTFLIHENGRYAFWRDEPCQKNILIVYCNNESSFPEIKVVGNTIEHAILHLCEGNQKNLGKHLPIFDGTWPKQIKEIQKLRTKNKVGEAPHEVGIWVKIKDKLGYRSLVESTKNMKKMLTTLKTTKDEEIISKYMSALSEELRHVQIANDECDFGMGLEYGHWLFLANTERVSSLTLFSLKMAYTFLARQEFFTILEKTINLRREKKN